MPKTLYKLSQKHFLKKTPEKFWADKETEYGGILKKICKEEVIEVYSTMSKTKAALAERAIQSLEQIIYRYIEDHGEYLFPYCSTLFLH